MSQFSQGLRELTYFEQWNYAPCLMQLGLPIGPFHFAAFALALGAVCIDRVARCKDQLAQLAAVAADLSVTYHDSIAH